jgi:hypothetical protein
MFDVDSDFNLPSAVLAASLAKWALVYDERNATCLWLAKAAPRRWYAPPPATAKAETSRLLFGVQAATSRFGAVSFNLTSGSGGNHSGAAAELIFLDVTLRLSSLQRTTGPPRVLVRVRDFLGGKRRIVDATGPAVVTYSARREMVELRLADGVPARASVRFA